MTKAEIENIKIEAEKYDNETKVAWGVEYYSGKAEINGQWTERDIFIMRSLGVSYDVHGYIDEVVTAVKSSRKNGGEWIYDLYRHQDLIGSLWLRTARKIHGDNLVIA